MEKLSLIKCKATGKTRYENATIAKEAMLKLKGKAKIVNFLMNKRLKHRGRKQQLSRYYRCEFCYGYHLTSWDTGPQIKKSQKERGIRVRNTQGLVRTKEEAEEWKQDSLPFPNIKPVTK